MFNRSTAKLDDARAVLDSLRAARDAPTFKAQFSSFLSAARAVTNAIQKDGAEAKSFKEWYKVKQDEMRGDELLRFLHDARTEDFHEGKHRLQFGCHVEHFSPAAAGPLPPGCTGWVIGSMGPGWIRDAGKPAERFVPINTGGSFAVVVSIHNAPKTHLGKPFDRNHPITFCELTIDYLEKLVHCAKTVFAT